MRLVTCAAGIALCLVAGCNGDPLNSGTSGGLERPAGGEFTFRRNDPDPNSLFRQGHRELSQAGETTALQPAASGRVQKHGRLGPERR